MFGRDERCKKVREFGEQAFHATIMRQVSILHDERRCNLL
jgi:hypothetical protein